MDKDTHVYCTNCKWFRYGTDFPCCFYEKECCIDNCEDSMEFKYRPHYETYVQ